MAEITSITQPSLELGTKLVSYLGTQAAISYDQYVFVAASHVTQNEYKGGAWELVEIKDGMVEGMYIRLSTDSVFPLYIPNKEPSQPVSADTMSLLCNLIALNTLIVSYPDDTRYLSLYNILFKFAGETDEADILREALK